MHAVGAVVVAVVGGKRIELSTLTSILCELNDNFFNVCCHFVASCSNPGVAVEASIVVTIRTL